MIHLDATGSLRRAAVLRAGARRPLLCVHDRDSIGSLEVIGSGPNTYRLLLARGTGRA